MWYLLNVRHTHRQRKRQTETRDGPDGDTRHNQKHVHEAEARGRRQWINTIERHRSALPGHNIYSKKWRDIHLIIFFEFLPDDVREEWIPLDSAFWEEIGPLWLTKHCATRSWRQRRTLSHDLTCPFAMEGCWSCCHITLFIRLSERAAANEAVDKRLQTLSGSPRDPKGRR